MLSRMLRWDPLMKLMADQRCRRMLRPNEAFNLVEKIGERIEKMGEYCDNFAAIADPDAAVQDMLAAIADPEELSDADAGRLIRYLADGSRAWEDLFEVRQIAVDAMNWYSGIPRKHVQAQGGQGLNLTGVEHLLEVLMQLMSTYSTIAVPSVEDIASLKYLQMIGFKWAGKVDLRAVADQELKNEMIQRARQEEVEVIV